MHMLMLWLTELVICDPQFFFKRPRFGQTVSEALIQTIRYSWFALFCFDEKNSLSVTAQRGHYTCAVNIKDEFILLDDECQPRKVDIQLVQKNVRLLAIRTWGQQVILMPYMDSQIPNSFRKTNNSPTERIFMLDL